MYRILIKSVETGGICQAHYGFKTMQEAQRFIQSLQKPYGAFWYEILKEE